MKITIDIPDELLDEAMRATGAKSKLQLIVDALHAQVDHAKRKRLLASKGKIDLDIDLDVLRNREV